MLSRATGVVSRGAFASVLAPSPRRGLVFVGVCGDFAGDVGDARSSTSGRRRGLGARAICRSTGT